MVKASLYGGWTSPITAELVAKSARRPGHVAVDGDAIYWLESRPEEGGRVALLRSRAGGSPVEVSMPDMNVRTRVHEYGGGSYVAQHGVVAYANFTDQLLYLVENDGVRPLTTPGMRYADGVVDKARDRIVSVREDHTGGGEAENSIVALSLTDSGAGEVLVSGHDFYSTPRLSPDGKRLCWLAWNHPEMPWTRTELWTADVDEDGSLTNLRCLVDGDESVFQPSWSPDNRVYFVSDRGGWWNLYRWAEGNAQPLLPMEAEFGRPQWVFGLPAYGFRDADRVVCSYTQDGVWRLAELDVNTGAMQAIEIPYTSVSDVHVAQDDVVFVGASPTIAPELVRLSLESGDHAPVGEREALPVAKSYMSIPRSVRFPTADGMTAYGFFYAPTNADFEAPAGERPPLMVISHGGPTGQTSSDLSLSIQFWTSRGFAVLDVNYGGSTGYGRTYRQRLDDKWGIVDVDDCVAGAQYLAERGEVDGERMVIRGGSAGGFTTLAALTFRDVFRAGASYFGVSDLGALSEETHKFESRYLDGLVGPYPKRRDIYEARSPIYHVDQLSCPIIFLQGLEDKVVPPNQAETMVDALREKGLPVAYLAYEGEQHGFRRAENIARSLTAELYFYSKILRFPLLEDVEPIPIENLA